MIADSNHQRSVLAVGLEFAECDANVSLEYLKTSPHIVTAVPADQVPRWLEIGVELTQTDLVVGLEYIRTSRTSPGAAMGGSAGLAGLRDETHRPERVWQAGLSRHDGIPADEPDDPWRYRGAAPFPRDLVGSQLASHTPATGIAWLAESPAGRFVRCLRHRGGSSCFRTEAFWPNRIRRPPWRISGAVRKLVKSLGRGKFSAFGRYRELVQSRDWRES